MKLDLGVHIDGYIAVVAHTVFLSADKKGKAVDAMLAAHYCAEAALRLVAPGVEVITLALEHVLKVYKIEHESHRCRLENLGELRLQGRRGHVVVSNGEGYD